MGDCESWVWPSGLLPNGLLPNEVASVTRMLDPERWSLAEKRAAELISRIQPNQPSEGRRNAVANYVQHLIMKCFPCQVCTFGSVPLKTYLQDGDIDLTVFSKNQSLKDSWANEVRDILEHEEKNENAEFRVKEVQCIQAEVKIIKCLVENILVDISFNQLGGLCKLCFLEEVDNLISQNHLFKRSIILIKAWCYYESRILGAHHGLISTYALETLVLYIFHVFSNSFAGPLEVLYRFLEFFSKFEWDNFCVSLCGPVPISSLPDMTADPPRKDGGELLLSKSFLDACSSVYAVLPGGQENLEQPFISKHFNVIDPLRTNNNLGRSVSRGNFFRIRSAFSFGAQRLAGLLACPKENLISEINQFFMNTWDRHGKGHRLDAPIHDLYDLRSINLNQIDGSDNFRNDLSRHRLKENSSSHDSVVEVTEVPHGLHGVLSQHGNPSFRQMSRSGNVSAVSQTKSQKTDANLNGPITSNKIHHNFQNISSNESGPTNNGRSSRPGYSRIERHPENQFASTQSSPELTDTSNDTSFQGRHNREFPPERSDNSRRIIVGSEVLDNRTPRFSTKDPSSRSGAIEDDYHSVAETVQMHQDEQNFINMKASRGYNFNGQVQIPANVTSANPPFPVPPFILASLGYDQKNSAAMMPTSIPSYECHWGPSMNYPQGLVRFSVSKYFPSIGVASDQEGMNELVDGGLVSTELNHEDSNHGFWPEQDVDSVRSDDYSNRSFLAQPLEDRQQFTSMGSNSVLSQYQRIRKNDVYGVESVDHDSPRSDDNIRESIPLSTVGADVTERNVSEITFSHFQARPMAVYEPPTLISGSNSTLTVAPVLAGSESQQRADDSSGGPPFGFYPTGPPVPFLAMLPVNDLPTEIETSSASTNHSDKDDELKINQKCQSDHLYSTKNLDQSEISNNPTSMKDSAPLEPFDNCESDILYSDFTSHWQNLQYGRLCQNDRHHGPLLYPSSVVVPPMYLQGHFPWDHHGRPAGNMNHFTQLMSYNSPLVPFSPLQPASNRPAGVYQHCADETNTYRGGTRTSLPNPRTSFRDRQSSTTRNYRGGYNYDKKDHHGGREGTWNVNSEPQFAGRGQGCSQIEKPSRFNKPPRASFRQDSFPRNYPQDGSFGFSNYRNLGSANVAYGLHPLQVVNPGGLSPSGTASASYDMLYPYDQDMVYGQDMSYGFAAQQFELESLGPVHFSGIDEASHFEGSLRSVIEQREYQGDSEFHSPDQPSSLHLQSGV